MQDIFLKILYIFTRINYSIKLQTKRNEISTVYGNNRQKILTPNRKNKFFESVGLSAKSFNDNSSVVLKKSI